MKLRRAVVTGASSGIGRACALRLDADGWVVYAGVLTTAEADELRAVATVRLRPITLDVTDGASIQSAADLVSAEAGDDGLDALVNNAGIAVSAPLELVPIVELRRQLEVNLIGPVAVTQAFLPLLRSAGGRIVNVGSAYGSVAIPFLGAYTSAKAALERITDTLRMELAPWKLRVSLIAPSRVDTPIWRTAGAAAVRLARDIPAEGRKLYDWPAVLLALDAAPSRQHEIPVGAVVTAVVHALTSPRPRRSYPISPSGRILRAVPHLPLGSIRDWVALRAIGFRRHPTAR